ncbi:MAG: HDOD domain-containing protein, partial [Gammaproteobacteria bacterium]|nr:HDOD domain-containing protein [Gammaproteobacteria bacterium]
RLKDLWAHSTSVAAISALLAKRYTKISPDEAMLAGLLHDIGELPVLKYVEKYPGLANDAEWLLKVRVGVVPIIGRAILVSWNFPKEIVNAIAKPADIAQNSGPIELVDIVVVADLHSMIGSGISGYQRPLHDFPVIQKFGLEPKQSIKMLKEAREDIHLIQFALSS